ncbi:hypothetical protein EG68_00818 [Paragonimus skrjabini miyazakii]|uniref:Uridylate-specific endoribonuclease n=1 Tax=Paragonimus skrjabini miyazakii TaxID=59628 RepID=A0A8S9Z3A4_9TREM|nr:hypothetical protein EG68_00818 [Paragonimus skrjabini miyazakii]
MIQMLYSCVNSSRRDSSAFEHVFVGENREFEVLGLHNWLQFARLEQMGDLNYLGHTPKACGTPPRVLTIAFMTKQGSIKPRGSMLLGTSPEFELAPYTTVFLSGQTQVRIHLDSCEATVVCHSMKGGRVMGTCYIK